MIFHQKWPFFIYVVYQLIQLATPISTDYKQVQLSKHIEIAAALSANAHQFNKLDCTNVFFISLQFLFLVGSNPCKVPKMIWNEWETWPMRTENILTLRVFIVVDWKKKKNTKFFMHFFAFLLNYSVSFFFILFVFICVNVCVLQFILCIIAQSIQQNNPYIRNSNIFSNENKCLNLWAAIFKWILCEYLDFIPETYKTSSMWPRVFPLNLLALTFDSVTDFIGLFFFFIIVK